MLKVEEQLQTISELIQVMIYRQYTERNKNCNPIGKSENDREINSRTYTC